MTSQEKSEPKIIQEKLVKFLYECGGACTTDIAMKQMHKLVLLGSYPTMYDEIMSAKRVLVKQGYIKPGTRAKPENLSWLLGWEVAKGKRSPYKMWELTEAGKKLAKVYFMVEV